MENCGGWGEGNSPEIDHNKLGWGRRGGGGGGGGGAGEGFPFSSFPALARSQKAQPNPAQPFPKQPRVGGLVVCRVSRVWRDSAFSKPPFAVSSLPFCTARVNLFCRGVFFFYFTISGRRRGGGSEGRAGKKKPCRAARLQITRPL